MAFGALFRVCRDPIARLGVVGALSDPFPHDRADAGAMVLFATAEAEGVPTSACHGWNGGEERMGGNGAKDGVGAVGGGAPTERFRVVDVGAV